MVPGRSMSSRDSKPRRLSTIVPSKQSATTRAKMASTEMIRAALERKESGRSEISELAEGVRGGGVTFVEEGRWVLVEFWLGVDILLSLTLGNIDLRYSWVSGVGGDREKKVLHATGGHRERGAKESAHDVVGCT